MSFKNILEIYLCKVPLVYFYLRIIFRSKDWDKKTFINIIRPGWTVIEIGANKGYFTTLFQKLIGNNGVIIAFEPIKKTFDLLQESLSDFPQNFQLYNMATGLDDSNSVDFYLPVNDDGQATMSPHESHSWRNQEIEKVICKVVRLDNFDPINQLKKIEFIKLDVEGAELPSLKGAINLLTRHKPIIYFEGCKEWMKSFKYTPKDFDQFLHSLNYKNLQVIGKKNTYIDSLETFFNDKNNEDSFNFLVSQY